MTGLVIDVAPNTGKRGAILEYLKNDLLPTVISGADYNLSLRTVERGHVNPLDLAPTMFPAVYIVTTSEQRKNLTTDKFQATLNVVLAGYVRDTKSGPNSSGTGVQKDLDKLIADLTKVLEADRLQGGLVYSTEVTDIQTDDGDIMPVAGCVVTVVFQYATEGANP